jgi:hypothetical protein
MLVDDAESGNKAMRAYREKYRAEHPGLIALGRQCSFFGLRLPMRPAMSVCVARSWSRT